MPTVRSTTQISNPFWLQQPFDPNRPIIPGLNEPAGAAPIPGTPGTIPRIPGTGGSPEAGRIPQVPSPTATQRNALAGNLANLARLRQLFTRTSNIAGITPGMTAAETGNINQLLNPPQFLSNYPDLARQVAETGSARGVAGSPAEQTLGYRLTDEERLRRQLLGSQLLGQRATRANTILPLQSFMQTPQDRQFWQNFANTLAASPDPELAFQRALQLGRQGLSQGFGAGYGGGAPNPAAGGVTAPQSTYAGDVNWNALQMARLNAIPTWPTLPTQTPSGAATFSLFAEPQGPSAPGSSFIGDINVPEDLYG